MSRGGIAPIHSDSPFNNLTGFLSLLTVMHVEVLMVVAPSSSLSAKRDLCSLPPRSHFDVAEESPYAAWTETAKLKARTNTGL